MTHGRKDYPLAETRPGSVTGKRGKALSGITLDAVLAGEVTMADLRITPRALQVQAEIAEDVGRRTLAANFRRAAELVDVPQDFIMEVYELLRPGRAASAQPLLEAAEKLRGEYGATRMADFVAEAARTYEERGLFKYRF